MRSRAQRRADRDRVIKKRLRLVKIRNKSLDIFGKTVYDTMSEKSNSLSKQHPMDCGQPQCLCCHYEKVLDKKKARDLKVEEMIKQQLKEDL